MVRTRLSSLFAVAIAAAFVLTASSVAAQDAPTKEDLEKAKVLAQEATTAEENGELPVAIEKYRAAYELFPDPNLLIKLGDSLRKNAENGEAIDAWQKYIDTITETCGKFDQSTCEKIDKQGGACVPKLSEPTSEGEEGEGDGEESEEGEGEAQFTCVGRYIEAVEERVSTVKQELAEKEEKDKEEAERIAREAEERRKQEEELARIEAEKLPMALSGVVMVGADQRLSVIGRLMAGGLIRFGKFAPEAHIAFEGFLRANSDKGTQAQSVTLIDLGARYSLGDEKFAGPFVTAGGGFGLFLGTPRDINLDGDSTSCAGFSDNRCTVQVDKHITGRAGFGYGFGSGDKATVAVRLDYTLWWYSVDTEQPDGVPVSQVELPQTAHAVTIGIEFLRWR